MSRNVFILLLSGVLLSCQETVEPALEAGGTGFNWQGNVLYFDKLPYTGERRLFTDSILTQLSHYKDGKKEGVTQIWYSNGRLAQQRIYRNNCKVGHHEGWWPNGRPKFSYHFNNKGQHHGELIEWYATGDTFQIFHHVNGMEEGSQKMWKSDGRIRANYEVVDGERYGLIGLKRCFTLKKSTNE